MKTGRRGFLARAALAAAAIVGAGAAPKAAEAAAELNPIAKTLDTYTPAPMENARFSAALVDGNPWANHSYVEDGQVLYGYKSPDAAEPPPTFERMQARCARLGCALEIHKRGDTHYRGMVNYSHDSAAPWPHTVHSINPIDARNPSHLAAVDAWVRSLHEDLELMDEDQWDHENAVRMPGRRWWTG